MILEFDLKSLEQSDMAHGFFCHTTNKFGCVMLGIAALIEGDSAYVFAIVNLGLLSNNTNWRIIAKAIHSFALTLSESYVVGHVLGPCRSHIEEHLGDVNNEHLAMAATSHWNERAKTDSFVGNSWMEKLGGYQFRFISEKKHIIVPA